MKIKQYVILVIFFMVGLLFVYRDCPMAQESSFIYGQKSIIHPGDSSSRIFGDFLVIYIVDSLGQNVRCTLFLSTQLVGLHTLVKDAPVYDFNVKMANSFAIGKLELKLGQYPQVSTISGNFTYSTSNKNSFEFIGDLVGWYIIP
jgi:hypothetical protein